MAEREIIYDPAVVSRRIFWRLTVPLYAVVSILFVGIGLLSGRWLGVVIYVALFIVPIILLECATRKRYVADVHGIRAWPTFRGSWDDITAVLKPTQWHDSVQVRRMDGSQVSTGFPVEYAERLAALGGKPLV